MNRRTLAVRSFAVWALAAGFLAMAAGARAEDRAPPVGSEASIIAGRGRIDAGAVHCERLDLRLTFDQDDGEGTPLDTPPEQD